MNGQILKQTGYINYMAVVLDQTYSESNVDIDQNIHYSAALADEVGQTFTPTISGPIPYIDLWIKRNGSPSGNISLQITTASGNLPTSTVLATSDAISAGGISTSYSKVRFTFSTPYSVTAATQYGMATTVTYALSAGVNNIQWGADNSSSSYSGGQDAYLNSGTWATNSRDGAFDQYVTLPSTGGSIILEI